MASRRGSAVEGKGEPAITLVVARLAERIDELADEIFAAYRERIPAYAEVEDPLFSAELSGICRLHAEALLRCVAEDRLLDETELATLRDIGRRRQQQGIPLHALLRAYQIGVRVVWGRLLDQMSQDDGLRFASRKLSETSNALLQLLEQVSTSVTDGYLESERARATLKGAGRDPVAELLEGSAREDTLKLLAGLGTEPGPENTVVTIGVKGAEVVQPGQERTLLRVRESVEEALKLIDRRAMVTMYAGTLVLIVPVHAGEPNRPIARAALRALERVTLPRGVRVVGGVGTVEPGMEGIPASYGQASGVLELLHVAQGLPAVMTYEEALPYTLLRQDPNRSMDVFRTGIEMLLLHDVQFSGRLVPTLDAYLDSGRSLAITAKTLQVHRSTVQRRLDLIRELTGMSPDSRDDCLLFELGLRTLHLLPGHLVEEAARHALKDDDRT